MEIIGYSERGAMNALFYGMAFDKEHGEESMKAFINELAKIEGDFSDFEMYNEFSLSEFGDPDMMIIAKDNKKGQRVVFFIEAKRSGFKLSLEKDHHNRYIENDEFENGHSSNLFFQLILKHYFFKICSYFFDDKKTKELDVLQEEFFKDKQNGFSKYDEKQYNRFKLGRKGNRKIGENVVVEKIVHEIQKCDNAYYIAIIPKQKTNEFVNTKEYGFDTYTITWEDIYSNFEKYVGNTFKFNQNDSKSQIMNQPINL